MKISHTMTKKTTSKLWTLKDLYFPFWLKIYQVNFTAKNAKTMSDQEIESKFQKKRNKLLKKYENAIFLKKYFTNSSVIMQLI